MQRIQVGVIGLASVLLLVSVANFFIQRASDERTVIEEMQGEGEGSAPPLVNKPEGKPSEPLAELGITPAPKKDPGESAEEKPARTVPGQTVPDLRPNPNLDAPMDRERR